ncbi:MAG: hypothetical protein WAZ45_02525, partial [Gemmiger qucibialis]
FAASSIICAFGLASAAPRSPYRHLELCGIALKNIRPLGPGTVKTVPYRLFYCAQRAINAYLTHRGAHCAPADVCLIAGWRNIR